MRQSTISRLFGQSPFPMLKEHMAKVKLCLDQVRPMMDAFTEYEGTREKEFAREIMKLEHEVDTIKNTIRDHLPKSIFLPVDRRDLLALLSAQDEIADVCEDLAVLVTIRVTKVHPGLKDSLFEYLDKSLEAAYLGVDVINELDAMLESSFGGKEAAKVIQMIDRISYLEWEADKKQYKLAQQLFELENEIPPVDIMLWFEIFKVIGNIANSAEKMAKRLRSFFMSQ
jgi:uncharacterized protein